MTDSDASPEVEESLALAVHAVYAATPDTFVATRKEWVTRLRSEGMREAAKQVASLRKPSVAAAAVNALVRAEDPVVEQLRDVGTRMRHAQSALDMAALATLRDERDTLLSTWVIAARTHAPQGSLTSAVESEVRDTAVAALADATATDVVTSGNLTRALSYSGFGEVDVADAVARTSTGVVLTRIEGGRRSAAEDTAPAEALSEDEESALSQDEASEDEPGETEPAEAGPAEAGPAEAGPAEAGPAEGPEGDEPIEDEPGGEPTREPPPVQKRPAAEDAGRVHELEMELDEAEKAVADARAARKGAAQADEEAEREVGVAEEQVAQAERLLASARKHLDTARRRRAQTEETLAAADRDLVDSRSRRDATRAALEEAEDA